jgi:hypothetical protein
MSLFQARVVLYKGGEERRISSFEEEENREIRTKILEVWEREDPPGALTVVDTHLFERESDKNALNVYSYREIPQGILGRKIVLVGDIEVEFIL